MMHAYDKVYLEDAMRNLGGMFDFAVNGAAIPMERFYAMFLSSEEAVQFGKGNPKYIAGLSGIELAERIILQAQDTRFLFDSEPSVSPSPEYWAGWALAYLQWYTGRSFAQLNLSGISASVLLQSYDPLHEADISKTLDVFLPLLGDSGHRLKNARKQMGLTQEALAEQSGISLRMIRAYEQGSQPLRRAEAETLLALARCLNVSPDYLL